jgi:hypothetical protein
MLRNFVIVPPHQILLRQCDLGEVDCRNRGDSRVSTWEPSRIWEDNIWERLYNECRNMVASDGVVRDSVISAVELLIIDVDYNYKKLPLK